MYLSRLDLDLRHRAVRRDLGNCQALHRTVMAAFPPAPDGASPRHDFGVLHRVDARPRTASATLLVQSRVRPDWSGLPPGYCRAARDASPTPAIKEIGLALAALSPGTLLRFRLRANPTRKVETTSKSDRLAGRHSNGRRLPVREDDCLAWLERRGARDGFRLRKVALATPPDVLNVRTARGPALHGRRPSRDGGSAGRLTFASVQFDGLLEVTDATAFRAALSTGIGPAKAYGFGLLSFAPTGRSP